MDQNDICWLLNKLRNETLFQRDFSCFRHGVCVWKLSLEGLIIIFPPGSKILELQQK